MAPRWTSRNHSRQPHRGQKGRADDHRDAKWPGATGRSSRHQRHADRAVVWQIRPGFARQSNPLHRVEIFREVRPREPRAGWTLNGRRAILNFGLANLGTFAWVGGFSSAPNTK